MEDKKWELIHRDGTKALGFEIYQNTQDTTRYLVKIFAYNTTILLSGDKEMVADEIEELKWLLGVIQVFFPEREDPPF